MVPIKLFTQIFQQQKKKEKIYTLIVAFFVNSLTMVNMLSSQAFWYNKFISGNLNFCLNSVERFKTSKRDV